MRWQDHAACLGADLRVFFPKRINDSTAARAKRICRDCPVMAECLEHELAQRDYEQHGIYGGLTPDERKAYRRRRRYSRKAATVNEARAAVAAGSTVSAAARHAGMSLTATSRAVRGLSYPLAPGPVRPTGKARNTLLNEQIVEAARISAANGTSPHRLAHELRLSLDAMFDMLTGRTWPDAGGPIRPKHHKPAAVLTPELARQARLDAAAGVAVSVLAAKLDVTPGTVWHALTGRTWGDAGGPLLRYNQPARRWEVAE